jgi:hypothetical protein
MPRRPITESVETSAATGLTQTRASDLHLLRDCLALGERSRNRVPAKVRLEEALGPDLARRLLSSLSLAQRR